MHCLHRSLRSFFLLPPAVLRQEKMHRPPLLRTALKDTVRLYKLSACFIGIIRTDFQTFIITDTKFFEIKDFFSFGTLSNTKTPSIVLRSGKFGSFKESLAGCTPMIFRSGFFLSDIFQYRRSIRRFLPEAPDNPLCLLLPPRSPVLSYGNVPADFPGFFPD